MIDECEIPSVCPLWNKACDETERELVDPATVIEN